MENTWVLAMGDSPVGAPPNGPALAAYKPSTKHPFTPTAQDGFEFVADPKSTVTNFAQIGHEHNLADALATGYAASTPGTLLAGPLT